jgi:hypothetical protein
MIVRRDTSGQASADELLGASFEPLVADLDRQEPAVRGKSCFEIPECPVE